MLLDTNDDETREEQARQAILQQSGITEDGQVDATTAGSDGADTVNAANHDQQQQQQQRREREQERAFDNLESALRQASSIREMSRTANLSDEDRRKRAGDAANLLLTLMQQVGMDDDDDSDEEEEETVEAT